MKHYKVHEIDDLMFLSPEKQDPVDRFILKVTMIGVVLITLTVLYLQYGNIIDSWIDAAH